MMNLLYLNITPTTKPCFTFSNRQFVRERITKELLRLLQYESRFIESWRLGELVLCFLCLLLLSFLCLLFFYPTKSEYTEYFWVVDEQQQYLRPRWFFMIQIWIHSRDSFIVLHRIVILAWYLHVFCISQHQMISFLCYRYLSLSVSLIWKS